jgi:hypothetical protein
MIPVIESHLVELLPPPSMWPIADHDGIEQHDHPHESTAHKSPNEEKRLIACSIFSIFIWRY